MSRFRKVFQRLEKRTMNRCLWHACRRNFMGVTSPHGEAHQRDGIALEVPTYSETPLHHLRHSALTYDPNARSCPRGRTPTPWRHQSSAVKRSGAHFCLRERQRVRDSFSGRLTRPTSPQTAGTASRLHADRPFTESDDTTPSTRHATSLSARRQSLWRHQRALVKGPGRIPA